MEIRAIDLWVNTNLAGSGEAPAWLTRVKEDYFKAGSEFFQELSVEGLIEVMDRVGVQKSVLSCAAHRPEESVLEFAAARPDRFALALNVDPTHPMRDFLALEPMLKAHPVVMARVVPFLSDLPPHHRNYYPLYAKCVELDLPISINTGIPGPPKPGECQHPMHLDRVCFDFPDLKVCMAHGADPWWDVAIRLMLKYANLRMMTSAYAPKYLPSQLIHFMNTRGQDRILFASDHPVLSMERCLDEAQQLDLRPGVLDKFLYSNAESFFFSPRSPHSPATTRVS